MHTHDPAPTTSSVFPKVFSQMHHSVAGISITPVEVVTTDNGAQIATRRIVICRNDGLEFHLNCYARLASNLRLDSEPITSGCGCTKDETCPEHMEQP